MLSVENISYAYQKNVVLKNINFQVKKGQHIALMGESGCGKSTLLKAVYGLFDIEKGKITYNNEVLLGPKFHLVPGHPFMKYLSQDLDIMPYTSVRENIGDFLSNFFPEEKQQRVAELMEVVGLTSFANTHVRYLSGGQKQRVALARVLAKQPEVLLLDEPFSQIDNFKKNKLRYQLFEFIKKEKITCITATHDKDDALPFADKILILKSGKQQSFQSASETFSKPKDVYCASLFAEVNTISEKSLMQCDSDDTIMVYPHQISINKTGKYNATVLKTYFKGSYYTIFLNFKNQKIIANSTIDFALNSSVNFDINLPL